MFESEFQIGNSGFIRKTSGDVYEVELETEAVRPMIGHCGRS